MKIKMDKNKKNIYQQSELIRLIMRILKCEQNEVRNIQLMKQGMTNRSFDFWCREKHYIMRVPGEGTKQLINRQQEASVYRILEGRNICENIIYISEETGIKISEFIPNIHSCDKRNWTDVSRCMEKLREFHELGLEVDHTFDLFEQILFYESLWKTKNSVFADYEETKMHVFSLKEYVKEQEKVWTLCHIDAVPDNCLMDESQVFLIDWEYAGMQDAHVDIAMFAIYAMYQESEIEQLIDLYFRDNCPPNTRKKIYCYIAICGLLWSNWSEYKRGLGVEFGEYALKQYRYAKDYYRKAVREHQRGKN